MSFSAIEPQCSAAFIAMPAVSIVPDAKPLKNPEFRQAIAQCRVADRDLLAAGRLFGRFATICRIHFRKT